jgi:Low affinity iron permease
MWAMTGPFFNFSDTWQLVINTGTTIVTFLMVFLIQNSQNRDAAAIQVKLDELIRVSKAQNAFIGLEHLTEDWRRSVEGARRLRRPKLRPDARGLPAKKETPRYRSKRLTTSLEWLVARAIGAPAMRPARQAPPPAGRTRPWVMPALQAAFTGSVSRRSRRSSHPRRSSKADRPA